MAEQLQIDKRTVARAVARLCGWGFLQHTVEPGKSRIVLLNTDVIRDALEQSKNNLLTCRQNAGFLTVLE